MTHNKYFLCFAFLVFMVFNVTNGQNTRISGYLKDSDNNPIVGATAALNTLKANTSVVQRKKNKGAFSDVNGFFEIKGVEPDTYLLKVSITGLAPISQQVIVASGAELIDLGTITMAVNSATIKEVVISAKKRIVDFKSDRIVYNVANDPDRNSSQLIDLLQKIPMVSVDAGDKILLKGKSNYKIMIDGRIAKGMSPSEIFKTYPPNSISRIEIITNPGSRYDAEGTSDGIINIVTAKKLIGYTGSVSLMGNTLPSHNESFSFIAKRNKVGIVSMGGLGGNQVNQKSLFTRNNFFEQALRTETRNGFGRNKSNFKFANVEIAYEPDSFNTFSIYGNYMKFDMLNILLETHKGTGFDNTLIESGHYFDSAVDVFDDNNFGIDYIRKYRKVGRESSILTALNVKRVEDDLQYDRVFELGPSNTFVLQTRDQSEKERIIELSHTEPLGNNMLSFGSKAILRDYQSEYAHKQTNSIPEAYTLYPDQSGIMNYEQNIAAAFADYEFNLKKWSIKPGIRYEYTTIGIGINNGVRITNDFGSFFPSLSASLMVNEQNNLQLSYARKIVRAGTHYLNPQKNTTDPRNTSSGNPYLDPEYVQTIEANWGYVKNRRNININLDFRLVNDVINPVVLVDVKSGISHFTFFNTGRTYSNGLTVSYSDFWKKKASYSANLRVAYESLIGYSGSTSYKNDGITGNFRLNFRYNLPKTWSVQAGGNIRLGTIDLQGRDNIWYGYQISTGKSALKNKKMRLTFTINQPFERWRTTNSTSSDPSFFIFRENTTIARSVQLSCNWRFGVIRENVSRKRGIVADDLKQESAE